MIAWISCPASNDTGQSSIPLTLTVAEDLLLHQNHDLIASRQALVGAQTNRATAGQRPNPTLSISTLAIDPRRVGAGSDWGKSMDTAVQLSQSLERGGKRDLRSAAASHNVLAAGLDVDEVRRQQILLLRQAYFDVHLAQEHVSISRETVRAFRRTSDAADVRFKEGANLGRRFACRERTATECRRPGTRTVGARLTDRTGSSRG